jgi:hypothetical protein
VIMGKFSWDERDPFEGMRRVPRNPWPIRLAFILSVIVGAGIAYMARHGIS